MSSELDALLSQEDSEVKELEKLTALEIRNRTKMLENELKFLKSEDLRLKHQMFEEDRQVADNKEKIKLHKQLPYLVGNVVEIIDLHEDPEEEEGSGMVVDQKSGKGKAVVVKTSTRQTILLPVSGLVDSENLRPGDLVGLHKDSFLILDTLPPEYDARVKAMEVDEKPTEDYGDIGGLEKQITELKEAIVLPITHKSLFDEIGITPPKGVILYGPPGTGKTLMARACAAQTNSTFLKLAGPQLVQMFIGDGAKLVRDAFDLAKEKSPAIIFIDELDAIGTKRFNSEKSGDREVQRTMLELLNQLDGFTPNDSVKVIAATNRVDILDPALLRSGRIDRKIEFPLPNEEARARILVIHSRKMATSKSTWFHDPPLFSFFISPSCSADCVDRRRLIFRLPNNRCQL